MTAKLKIVLLRRLIDDRDELIRLKINAILRGASSATDCPEVVAAEKKWQRRYDRLVKAIEE